MKKSKPASFAQLSSAMKDIVDDNVSRVQGFLDDLLEETEEKHQQKLRIISQVRDDCDEERNFRQEEIVDGQESLEASQTQLKLCQSQAERATYLRDLAQDAYTAQVQALEELNAAREAGHRLYQTRLASLTSFRDAIAQVQALMDEFEAEGTAPLDLTSLIQKTNKVFQHTVKTGQYAMVMPIYTKLISLHSRGKLPYDPADVEEVRSILTQIDDNVAVGIHALDDQEAQDQAAYEVSRDKLEAIIARLSAQIAFTSGFLSNMDQCVAQEESISNLSTDKVRRNTDLLAVAEKLCSASEDEFQTSEKGRRSLVSIIGALKSAVVLTEADYRIDILGNSNAAQGGSSAGVGRASQTL